MLAPSRDAPQRYHTLLRPASVLRVALVQHAEFLTRSLARELLTRKTLRAARADRPAPVPDLPVRQLLRVQGNFDRSEVAGEQPAAALRGFCPDISCHRTTHLAPHAESTPLPQASKTYLEKKFDTFPGASVDEARIEPVSSRLRVPKTPHSACGPHLSFLTVGPHAGRRRWRGTRSSRSAKRVWTRRGTFRRRTARWCALNGPALGVAPSVRCPHRCRRICCGASRSPAGLSLRPVAAVVFQSLGALAQDLCRTRLHAQFRWDFFLLLACRRLWARAWR